MSFLIWLPGRHLQEEFHLHLLLIYRYTLLSEYRQYPLPIYILMGFGGHVNVYFQIFLLLFSRLFQGGIVHQNKVSILHFRWRIFVTSATVLCLKRNIQEPLCMSTVCFHSNNSFKCYRCQVASPVWCHILLLFQILGFSCDHNRGPERCSKLVSINKSS